MSHAPHLTPASLVGRQGPQDGRFLPRRARVGAGRHNAAVHRRQADCAGHALERHGAGAGATERHAEGCDIVNCDSSHLFAVSRAVGIRSIQCGVVSDVVRSGGAWDSKLAAMLTTRTVAAQDPMSLAGKLATFYVESILPALARG